MKVHVKLDRNLLKVDLSLLIICFNIYSTNKINERITHIYEQYIFQFKERDFLEGIFKFWRNPSLEIFEAVKHW